MESAARYVENVDTTPVVIFDGLTKNWRYPGWRVTWTVGPRDVIDAVASAGSFLDGGGSKPMQRAAVPLLALDHARAETAAIQQAFAKKRDLLVAGLRRLGVTIDCEPQGTFYVWGSVADLPAGHRRRPLVLPRRARAPRHRRSGRILRRQPRQAARPPGLALPPPRPLLVRAERARAHPGPRPARSHGGLAAEGVVNAAEAG